MSGPDGVNVPSQRQGIPGDKTVADIAGEDYALELAGTNVAAKGTLKNVTKPWTAFDSKDNTGHFAPITLPADLTGTQITLSGRSGGDKTVTVDEDRLLIQRIENLDGDTLTIKDGEGANTLMTVGFAGCIPQGEKAIDPNKTDFGSFGKTEDYVKDIVIRWDGVKGFVTGTIKKHDAVGTDGKVKAGYHYPLGLAAYYFDGTPKTVTIGEGKPKNVTDKDIICDVSKGKTIKIGYNGKTVLELDLNGATFEQKD